MNVGRLTGSIAIVTGGGSGIGAGICKEFAAQGARVMIADLNRQRGDAVASDICQSGAEAVAFEVDVTDPKSVQSAANAVIDRYDTIDILVNCAGWNSLKPAEDYTLDDWEKIRSLNLDSCWYMSKVVMPTMIKRCRGKILNISSGSGILAQPRMAAYGAAKHGVVGMTKTLAVDLARYQINVNCICPATVETPLVLECTTQAFRDFQIERIPLGRLGTVSDIAKAALFLCSSDADWITGAILPVDGGLTCCAVAQPIVD